MNESDEDERVIRQYGNKNDDSGMYRGIDALSSIQNSLNLDEEECSLPSADVNNILYSYDKQLATEL